MQELLGLSPGLAEYFISSGRTDLGVTGEEEGEKLLSEKEEDPIMNFPNELALGLNSFFCSSSSMTSNLSLANFIKQSSVANIVSPAKQTK